jgi:hypothetical protein
VVGMNKSQEPKVWNIINKRVSLKILRYTHGAQTKSRAGPSLRARSQREVDLKPYDLMVCDPSVARALFLSRDGMNVYVLTE